MNAFKTELFNVSFDKNDISKIVHIEHIKSEQYQSYLILGHLVSATTDLLASGMLSKSEAVKIINKASVWML